MASRIHGLKPLRIAALFHARRIVRKSARAAAKLIPKRVTASNLVFWVVIAFLFAPLAVLLVYSFNASRSGDWSGFSLAWYKKLFADSPDLWRAFQNSILIALTSALMATVLGTLAAVGTTRYSFKFKTAISTMSSIPMILPEIVVGVSLLVFFAGIGLNLGLVSVWIAHTTFNIPFVYLLVSARLEESDPTIVEAAKDLGATEWQTLSRVIVPMALPGVASAFLTAVTLSLEDFVITFFVSGPGATTLPLYIYSMIRFGVSPVVNALSAVMVAGTVLLVYPLRNFLKVFAAH
ncbi:MAG TPA: ABC transporter permease [Rectinemataceae bacterium]